MLRKLRLRQIIITIIIIIIIIIIKGFLIKKCVAPYTHRENVRGKSFFSQKPNRKNSVMIPTSATSFLLRAERESKTEM